jgi:DNA polymerase-3 subunit chi
MHISTYQIQPVFFKKTFGNLISKLLLLDKQRICIICRDEHQMQFLDEVLWTFSQLSFLPHLTEKDNINNDSIPIVLTNQSCILNAIPVFMSCILAANITHKHHKMFIIDNESKDLRNLEIDHLRKKISHKIFIQDTRGKWKKVIAETY